MNDHQYNPSSMRGGRINNYGNSRSSNNAGPRGSMSGSSFTNQGKGSLLGSGPSSNLSLYKSNYSNRNSNANNQQYSSSKGQQNYSGNMSGNGSSMGYGSHNQLGYSGSSQQSFSDMKSTATSQQPYSSFSSGGYSGNYEKSGMSSNRSNYSSNKGTFNDPYYNDSKSEVSRRNNHSNNFTSQTSKDEEDLMNAYGLGQQDVRKMLSMSDKELESTYNSLQKRRIQSGSMNYEQNDGYTSRSSGKSNYPEFNSRSRSDNAPPRSSSFKNDLGNSMYSNSNDESRLSQHSVSSGMRRSNFKSLGDNMASSQHGNTFDNNYDEFDNNYSRGRSSRRNLDLNLTNNNRSNQTRFNADDNMRRSQVIIIIIRCFTSHFLIKSVISLSIV